MAEEGIGKLFLQAHMRTTMIITSSGHDNLITNWLVFDIGFANINDQTNYEEANKSNYLYKSANEDPFTKSTLKLTTKSSNVNIWAFMQRLSISKHVLNLKYGLGYEMFNFFYDQNISYNKANLISTAICSLFKG